MIFFIKITPREEMRGTRVKEAAPPKSIVHFLCFSNKCRDRTIHSKPPLNGRWIVMRSINFMSEIYSDELKLPAERRLQFEEKSIFYNLNYWSDQGCSFSHPNFSTQCANHTDTDRILRQLKILF